MNTYSKQILILALLLFGVNACKEKDCHTDGSCAQDYRRHKLGVAKDYLWANKGSWWIYKNTKTGELDTQTVNYFKFDSAISKGTEEYSKHITIEYDVLHRNIYSTFNNWEYNDRTTRYYADGSQPAYVFFGLDRYVGGEGIISPFHIPFESYITSGTGSSVTKYVGIDSVFILNGKTYKNVLKFELNMDDIWYPNNMNRYPNSFYYWSVEIGLIKRENKTENFSWELIDYNIVQ